MQGAIKTVLSSSYSAKIKGEAQKIAREVNEMHRKSGAAKIDAISGKRLRRVSKQRRSRYRNNLKKWVNYVRIEANQFKAFRLMQNVNLLVLKRVDTRGRFRRGIQNRKQATRLMALAHVAGHGAVRKFLGMRGYRRKSIKAYGRALNYSRRVATRKAWIDQQIRAKISYIIAKLRFSGTKE